MNDENTQSESIAETPAPTAVSEPVSADPVSQVSTGSTLIDMPLEAPESSTNASTPVPVESQNGGVNEPESNTPETLKESQTEAISATPVQPVSAPAPQTSVASQPQSLAQQDQIGFIHSLLIKAQAKIQSNKRKKLEKIILFAQKKRIIANEDVQKFLYVSDRTATRYLVELVQQGRLSRIGDPRDAKYQFMR